MNPVTLAMTPMERLFDETVIHQPGGTVDAFRYDDLKAGVLKLEKRAKEDAAILDFLFRDKNMHSYSGTTGYWGTESDPDFPDRMRATILAAIAKEDPAKARERAIAKAKAELAPILKAAGLPAAS